MDLKRIALVTFVLMFVASSALLADSRIEFKVTEGKGATLEAIMIGHGKIRTDADKNTTVIFDPTAGSMTLLDHSRKTFTRMTKADIDQLAATLDGMMKQMEQAMANVPPEMRERMAAMTGRAGGGMAGVSAVETVDTGKSSTVAGRSCRIFQNKISNRVVSESCLGEASAIDLPAADRATLAAAMAWSKELTDKLAKGPLGRIGGASVFRGGLVPLRSTIIGQDGSRDTSEFTGVVSTTIPATVFAVPEGYKEQKMEVPGRGRGGRP